MKYLDEYRNASLVHEYAREIARVTTRPWTLMEVCGGQTHAIVKYGLDQILPPGLRLLHGPGCPVCVTPLEVIEKALEIASKPNVIFCSFGDMLRVPGRSEDLLSVKARGADVRIVYSPLDALKIAADHPTKEIVFFAVGFETTAPAVALTACQAANRKLRNFSLLISHVLVPPALETILQPADCQVQAFLAAGHVCAITGYEEYEPISTRYKVPIVVTGFEPLDLLQGILMCLLQLESGKAEVQNQYSRAVDRKGNPVARTLINEVFQVTTRKWRGIGAIPNSGLALTPAYATFDAERRFGLSETAIEEPSECQSGLVLRGLQQPSKCPAFGTRCTPEHPLGATMVSSEGACAAYFRYRFREPASSEI